MKYSFLKQEEIDHFIQYGFVKIPGAMNREFCEKQTSFAFERLGYDPADPKTWVEPKIHMPSLNRWKVKDIAPDAFAAMCDLAGGSERIKDPDTMAWGDGFVLNFSFGADSPWHEPSAAHSGWHKDGDFFYHFLDSSEQGLLCAVYWSDIQHKGGGTYIIADSVPVVADFLNTHREGIAPNDPRWRELPGKCSDFREVTADAGDVYLLHPFMLHASSQNVLGIPRFMTNPCMALSAPMEFNRDDADEFSPIERAVLSGLGVDRLDYSIGGERRANVPERIARQQKLLEKELERVGEKREK